ncbi:hypothetical protein Bca101_024995 [Brassica carinata]
MEDSCFSMMFLFDECLVLVSLPSNFMVFFVDDKQISTVLLLIETHYNLETQNVYEPSNLKNKLSESVFNSQRTHHTKPITFPSSTMNGMVSLY